VKIDGKLRFEHVHVGEIRAALIGANPRLMVKFAITDEAGRTFTSFPVFTGFSKRTMDLLDQFVASAEQDAIELMVVMPTPEDGDDDSTINLSVQEGE
jgi:hypothetical protein